MGDLTGRETVLAPVADLGPGCRIDTSGPATFWRRLVKVQLTLNELMSEVVDVALRIAETISYHLGRKTLDERSSQCLVAALPFAFGLQKEVFISHANLIYHDGYSVKNKMVKNTK